jgi:hypothetical protein
MVFKRVLAGALFHIPQPYRIALLVFVDTAGGNDLAVGRDSSGKDGNATVKNRS